MKTNFQHSGKDSGLILVNPRCKGLGTGVLVPFHNQFTRSRAFSLLEMIGVLAVAVIIALAFALTTTKSLDRAFSSNETVIMQNFAYALQNSVLRNLYVPGIADWYTNIAIELGINPNMVLYTDRNRSRIFLVDPAFTVNGVNPQNGYTQTAAGASTAPTYRVMILSSVSAALPASIQVSTGNFNNIWTTADGSIPTSTDFSSYGGQPGDLIIQRINLTPLFMSLTLNNINSTTNGMYQIQGGTPALVTAAGTNVYYLQNTFLSLVDPSATPANTNAELMISRSFNFYYVGNVWRSVPYIPAYSVSQSNPTAADLASMFATAATMFSQSPGNKNATSGATPASVLSSMSNFLYGFEQYYPYATNYAAANGGAWPTTGALYTNAKNAQTAVYNSMNNLVGSGFSSGGCN